MVSHTCRSTGRGTRRPSITAAVTAATVYAPLQASASPCTPSDGNNASASTMLRPFSMALIQKGVRVFCNA